MRCRGAAAGSCAILLPWQDAGAAALAGAAAQADAASSILRSLQADSRNSLSNVAPLQLFFPSCGEGCPSCPPHASGAHCLQIPDACQGYFDGVPPSANPTSMPPGPSSRAPPPPKSAAAPGAFASAALLLITAALAVACAAC